MLRKFLIAEDSGCLSSDVLEVIGAEVVKGTVLCGSRLDHNPRTAMTKRIASAYEDGACSGGTITPMR